MLAYSSLRRKVDNKKNMRLADDCDRPLFEY